MRAENTTLRDGLIAALLGRQDLELIHSAGLEAPGW